MAEYELIDGLYSNLYSALISNTFSSPHFRHIVHIQSISTPAHNNILPNVEQIECPPNYRTVQQYYFYETTIVAIAILVQSKL